MIVGVFGPRDFRGVDRQSPQGGIAGNKFYNNYSYIADALDEYATTKIITGGGIGVEQLALRYAVEQSVEYSVVPPNMEQNGSDAFKIRNDEIIGLCDIIVVFWDGKDKFYFDLMSSAVGQQTLVHLRHME